MTAAGEMLATTGPMLTIVVVHAGVMIALGAVRRPVPVALTVGALLLVHAVVLATAPDGWSLLLRDGASQVAAGVVVGLDGGTESPFFFWVLLLFAGQALRHDHRRLVVLAAVVLVTYAAVVALTEDPSVANVSRFGLLTAFCGGLVYLRRSVDQKAGEARRLNEILRVGFDASPLAAAVLDEHLHPVYMNDRAARLFEDAAPDGATTTIVSSSGEVVDYSTGVRQGLREAMEEPQIVRIGDGRQVRDVRVFAAPVQADSDRMLLVIAEDVTEEVSAEAERTRFLQAAAHQFRTPLTPVMAYAQMIAAQELTPEESVRVSGIILKGAREIERTLDKLSALLRMRSGDRPEARDVAMSEICSSLVAATADLGATVECVGGDAVVARCAPGPAVLGLAELVRNGALHGVPPVVVEWTDTGDGVVVTVTDAGGGPALEDGAEIAGVWSIAYQSAAVSERMGTQLGLSQAVMLTELAGGTLEFTRSGSEWHFVARFPAGSTRGEG